MDDSSNYYFSCVFVAWHVVFLVKTKEQKNLNRFWQTKIFLHFFSLNYGSCSQGSNFQRTFPLRKSGKEDVSETYDIRQVLPTTTTSTIATPSTNTVNWKSSASTDRLSSQQNKTSASLDPFWTPSRTRRSLNKATHINGKVTSNLIIQAKETTSTLLKRNNVIELSIQSGHS